MISKGTYAVTAGDTNSYCKLGDMQKVGPHCCRCCSSLQAQRIPAKMYSHSGTNRHTGAIIFGLVLDEGRHRRGTAKPTVKVVLKIAKDPGLGGLAGVVVEGVPANAHAHFVHRRI